MTTGRVAIKAAIETAAADFAKVVADIGDAGWKKKSGIPAWTCGQLAWHVAQAFEFNAAQIKNASTSGKALNPPAFMRPTLYKLSELRVRLLSRKATPASVLTDLNAGIATLLATLASVDDDGLTNSATMMGDTRTIAEMFQLPVAHAAEHTAQIRAGLAAA
jgi:uncharacterized damage-inducible protein DinB